MQATKRSRCASQNTVDVSSTACAFNSLLHGEAAATLPGLLSATQWDAAELEGSAVNTRLHIHWIALD